MGAQCTPTDRFPNQIESLDYGNLFIIQAANNL